MQAESIFVFKREKGAGRRSCLLGSDLLSMPSETHPQQRQELGEDTDPKSQNAWFFKCHMKLQKYTLLATVLREKTHISVFPITVLRILKSH